jgi:hypothetical protein
VEGRGACSKGVQVEGTPQIPSALTGYARHGTCTKEFRLKAVDPKQHNKFVDRIPL